MNRLTRRQQEILTFIQTCIQRHGYPPTRLEIVEHFGFRSPTAAVDHLKALARKGAIHLEAHTSRGIRLADEYRDIPNEDMLPLVGRVAAGEPILASENIEDQIACDPSMFHPQPHYLLRVQGMSMRDCGILDGDLLAVHRTPEALDGQIVVARIDDEVTVKRFRRKGHQVTLIAENPDFDPIQVNLKHQALTIEGRGVGIIRNQLTEK